MKIVQYKNSAICSFEVILLIINNHLGTNFTINDIKNNLIKEYLKLRMPNTDLIINKYNVEIGQYLVILIGYKKEI